VNLSVPILTGRWVQLEPLAELHREDLRAAADDERIWRHTLTIARGAGFDSWFDDAFTQRDAGRQVPFAVRGLTDGKLIGSTSYLDLNVRHKRVEIGSTWYIPEVWGTQINPECKLLLMTHAFEVLEMNRVAYVTDLLNEHSQAAIAKLGAVREGVCRCHAVTQSGRLRDSVLFSIIRAEWPGVKARLEERVVGGNARG
jgi:RimJ/RimL family protein N-acetyltransferase